MLCSIESHERTQGRAILGLEFCFGTLQERRVSQIALACSETADPRISLAQSAFSVPQNLHSQGRHSEVADLDVSAFWKNLQIWILRTPKWYGELRTVVRASDARGGGRARA